MTPPVNTSDEHFVAHIRIEKVTKERNPGNPSPKREVDEVTSITLKDNDLSVIISKLKSHLDIIDD